MNDCERLTYFPGDSEMARQMRAFDWSQTPLGSPADWPQSLRTVVRLLLTSRYAMWLGWGADLTFFYNDAYARMTLGGKHPWALGRAAREVWAEIWHDIGPRAESVVRAGVATWDESLRLFLQRDGYPEETYHTFSYSPILDDRFVDGRSAVGGMLCVVTEDTERVIGERRMALLRELAIDLAAARTSANVFSAFQCRLSDRPHDLPFALAYLFDGDGQHARLVAACGVGANSGLTVEQIDLSDRNAAWPAGEIFADGAPLTVDDLSARFAQVPTGPWQVAARQAVVTPLARQGQQRPAGFLVVGVNPHRKLDTDYRGFIELLAGQLASGLANARAYEEEWRRAEALAELDRAKTTFFTNISHEFRTPLTLMLGPVEDLLAKPREGLMPENRELLEVVHRHSHRLLKLVNTLLDFSRIEAGRIQAHYELTDVAALTRELASNFQSAIEKAGMRLIVDCPTIEAPVYLDRNLWEKIVLNLLSNAFKFTFEGEIEVRLRQVGPSVELVVRDTGVGIPAKNLSQVFERFHRVEEAKRRSHEGTGIGLALVQELTRLHGGAAAVESIEGQGTTFTISIPTGSAHLPGDRIGAARWLSPSSVPRDAFIDEALGWIEDIHVGQAFQPDVRPDGHSRQAGKPDLQARPRILLADDNADMRHYVSRLLRPRFDVEAVANGRTALEALRRDQFALVLTDVMMPDLDGYELLRQIRADDVLRDLPVILLSARAGEEARIEGAEAGADEYLVKPFNARELVARVESCLRLAELRRQTAHALRDREERLRIALANSNTGTFRWDPASGVYLEFDDNLKWLFGLSPEQSVRLLDDLIDRIHPDDAPGLIAAIERRRNGEDFELEFRVVLPDGSTRWLYDRAGLRLDASGQPAYVVGACTDITGRRRRGFALRRVLAAIARQEPAV